VYRKLGGTRGQFKSREFFSVENERKIINCKEDFLHHRILPAVKRLEFVCDRVSCIVLRGRWSNFFLNVHAPREKKIDDSKDSFYEEL
jgi:hypothetical protein